MGERISIVIPTLNEAGQIVNTLQRLQPLRQRGHEVIVVDAASQDQTVALAVPLVDQILSSPKGRALQLRAGAEVASHGILWFLHADTMIPADADTLLLDAMQNSLWGRFDILLSGPQLLLRVVERMINLRSWASGIATGDQGIFVQRDLYQRIGGIPQQPLMEDVELSIRLKRWVRPARIRRPLITSSRRWEEYGILRTIALMWLLRGAYALGVPANRLAPLYR